MSAGEDLWELIKEAAGHCRIARLFESVNNEPYRSSEWEQLLRELIAIHQHYQAMVDHLCLDYVVFYGQYQQLLHIRDRWRALWAMLGERAASDDDGSRLQQHVKGHEEVFDVLHLKFKKLVVASRYC